MDYSHLTDHEIKALLMYYDSELRKLNFQMQSVQAIIQNLHAQLSGVALSSSALSYPVAPTSSVLKEMDDNQSNVENAISEVEVELPQKEAKTVANDEEIKEPKKRGPKKKEKEVKKEKRGYTKNSPWPGFILEQFAKYGHILSSGQLYDFAIEENSVRGYGLEVTNVRNLVSRALHRLANIEGTLAKLPVEEGAKGYNYAPKEWLDKRTGELKEKYIPR